MTDALRYDTLAQDALRGVIRTVLRKTATEGLPGEHHFFITFAVRMPGVVLSPRLRAQYEEAMTIVLQHRFYDLEVGEDAFSVGLTFGGTMERITVPFRSILSFADPFATFELAFQLTDEDLGPQPGAAPEPERDPLPEGGAAVVSLDAFRKRR
jgi:hypothetical protein